MDQETTRRSQPEQDRPGAGPSPSPDKQPWQEPKLAFVEPKLTKHGKLEEVTGEDGFFGGFTA
jgi:hypothetical protein